MDSKVYILKSMANNFTEKHEIIKFTTNEANYGGAVYVSDDGMCALSTSNKECFFQVLALYRNVPLPNLEPNDNIMCKNINFTLKIIKQESLDLVFMEVYWIDVELAL